MKIVAFSDIHGQQSKKLTQWFEANPADLLIFAGDLQLNNMDSGVNFLNWFYDLPYVHKVMIFGNHDGNSEYITNYLGKHYTNIFLLNNMTTTVEGIKIFGSPYTPMFGNWAFMEKDERLSDTWSDIPDDVDILVTHGPPFGILDRTIFNVNAGSKTLLKRVYELNKLKYHIFGHIQEAHGFRAIGKTTFLNVSVLDENYRFAHNPVTIDYEVGTVETDYNVGE